MTFTKRARWRDFFCLITLSVLACATPVLASLEGPDLLEPGEAVRILSEADASPYEGADRLVLFDRTEVEVEDTGLSHVYHHRFVEVLEFEGARAMRALPANQQEVLRLKFQNGFSYKQIAGITGLSVSNVGFLIHTGIQRLRKRFKATGLIARPEGDAR